MSTRKCALMFAVAAAALSAKTARADILWEHVGTLQSSMMPKQPLMQVKMYNTWTPQRHRLLLNYAFAPSVASRASAMESRMPTMPMQMPMLMPMSGGSSFKPYGSLGFVTDLQNDRVVAYESQSRMMVSEPRLALMKRLRFNPWKKLAPELANQTPPQMTDEQRTRLQAEIGALAAPIRKRFTKTYFRQLPGYKNFFGLIGSGYRLTQLLNVGGMNRNQSWMRVTTEWWIAPSGESDSDITQFNAQTQRDRKAQGGLTNSMWLNEMFALSQIPSDPILRAAWNSFRVPEDAPEGAFRGTPLVLTSKITLPPLQRATLGDMLFTLRLSARNNNALGSSVFDAPKGYKKYDVQPILKTLDPVLDGSAWISLWDYAFKNRG